MKNKDLTYNVNVILKKHSEEQRRYVINKKLSDIINLELTLQSRR